MLVGTILERQAFIITFSFCNLIIYNIFLYKIMSSSSGRERVFPAPKPVAIALMMYLPAQHRFDSALSTRLCTIPEPQQRYV